MSKELASTSPGMEDSRRRGDLGLPGDVGLLDSLLAGNEDMVECLREVMLPADFENALEVLRSLGERMEDPRRSMEGSGGSGSFSALLDRLLMDSFIGGP